MRSKRAAGCRSVRETFRFAELTSLRSSQVAATDINVAIPVHQAAASGT